MWFSERQRKMMLVKKGETLIVTMFLLCYLYVYYHSWKAKIWNLSLIIHLTWSHVQPDPQPVETVVQTGLNYLFRHKMNSLPGQPIKTAWASSFNAWTNSLQYCFYSCGGWIPNPSLHRRRWPCRRPCTGVLCYNSHAGSKKELI